MKNSIGWSSNGWYHGSLSNDRQDKRLETTLQYLHAEVNVQLQSRQDALEAAEDACALAEAALRAPWPWTVQWSLKYTMITMTMDNTSFWSSNGYGLLWL